jgi:predicted neuraminidase
LPGGRFGPLIAEDESSGRFAGLPVGVRNDILDLVRNIASIVAGLSISGMAGWASVQSPAAVPIPQPVLAREFIFPPQHPATPSCHASTIVELPGGALAAAWFGGTAEGRSDVGIWFSRFENGRWTPPREIADGAASADRNAAPTRHPCWNPVLFQASRGALLLFYKIGPSPGAWWGALKSSLDGGRTWSASRRLPEGIFGPIKNKPIEFADGTIFCGSSSEDHGWRVHMEWTRDGGTTWERTKALNDGFTIGAIQPSLLIHPGGRLQAIGRSRQGKIWTAWSADQGRTWGPPVLTNLPNPNSGTDALTLKDGRFILVGNPTDKGRTPLVAALSADGLAWTTRAVIEDGQGEFSYPAVIQTTDGRIHISYTWKRISIGHVVLDPKSLGTAPAQGIVGRNKSGGRNQTIDRSAP